MIHSLCTILVRTCTLFSYPNSKTCLYWLKYDWAWWNIIWISRQILSRFSWSFIFDSELKSAGTLKTFSKNRVPSYSKCLSSWLSSIGTTWPLIYNFLSIDLYPTSIITWNIKCVSSRSCYFKIASMFNSKIGCKTC